MCGIIWMLALTIPAAEPLTAGVATVDITPPVGFRMAGYFQERLSTAVHDPLQAKCLVFAQGDHRMALVCCDLIGISREVSGRARELAGKQTGIPTDNIAIIATHAHTGPLYFDALRTYFHEKAIAEKGQDPCETIDYSAVLADRLAEGIVKAKASLRPVRLEAGSIEQSPPVSFNRRFHMKSGPVRFNPGQLNPDIVRPAGPIDPSLNVVLMRDADTGRPIAALTSFALHADTTGGTAYSADYPFYLEKTLRAALGPDFVSVYGLGCCGDINHIDVSTSERRTAEELGTLLGRRILEALSTLTPVRSPDLAARQETVQLPLQEYSEPELARAESDMAGIGGAEMPFLDQVRTYKLNALRLIGRPELTTEVQVFRLSGDVAIVTLPGEVFVEFGLAIKKASPFKTTLVIELANDGIHYVPTRKAFTEGSYETVNCIIQPGGGERLADAAVRLLKGLGR